MSFLLGTQAVLKDFLSEVLSSLILVEIPFLATKRVFFLSKKSKSFQIKIYPVQMDLPNGAVYSKYMEFAQSEFDSLPRYINIK